MKIARKQRTVKACEVCGNDPCTCIDTASVTPVAEVTVAEVPVAEVAVEAVPSSGVCPYQKAIDRIMEAIDSLGEIASNDAVARESIANLSVILFDLKG